MRPEISPRQLWPTAAVLAVSAPAAVVLALLDVPRILVVSLALLAAFALITVAGSLSARRPADVRRPPIGVSEGN